MATTQAVLPPVREGDLLAGKYRVERVLGVGGMGIVVAARHEQLEHLVAIKFVRDDALGNPEAVERFVREARSAARLRSDHAARVLDVGKLESGAPYMVMEFLDGSDLAQVLVEGGPMSADVAVRLILQACEAVAEAHAAGIIHRDIKPQNLFLTTTVGGSPKLKVLDFGVSKASGFAAGGQGALTRTSAMLGSPLYMAPEQMRSSRDVDARCDIWALGVVLFELLTGRSPFEAETMPELCLKVVGDPPQSLAALRPDLPVALVGVVERCLEKSPTGRYANASELAAALEPFGPPSRHSEERSRISAHPMGSAVVERVTLPSSVVRSSNAPVAASARESAPARAAGGRTDRRHTVAWLLGGLLVVALLGAVSTVLIARRSDSGPPRASSPVARPSATEVALAQPVAPPSSVEGAGDTAARSRLADPPSPGELPAPAESANPIPPSAEPSAAAGSVQSATASVPLPTKLGSPALARTVSVVPVLSSARAVSSPRPSAASKSQTSDDDIPSLR